MIERSKFILQIKQPGAYLHYLSKGEIKETWSLDLDTPVPEFLLKNQKTPVHTIVDTPSINMEIRALPKLNLWDMWQLIQQKRLQLRDPHPLWGCRVLRQDKQWFIYTVTFDKAVMGWLDWLNTVENHLGAIRSLPHESLSIIQKLRNRSGWQMLMTLHDGGSLRMSLFNDDRLELSRVVALELDDVPEVLAESITTALKNTIDYIAREYPGVERKLNVFAVVDDETRKCLKPAFLERHQLHILTPYQLAIRLGLPGKVPFRLSDSVMVRAIVSKWWPSLRLTSAELRPSTYSLTPDARKWVMGACAVMGALIVERGIYLFSESHRLTALESVKSNLLHEQKLLIRKGEVS